MPEPNIGLPARHPRTDDTESKVLDLGAQDFLNKPVQPQSLQARVKAVLRRTRLH